MLHYLPGCDVRKNHPAAVLVMQEYMDKNGAVIDQCCRVKNKFLESEDVIVNNCTLCHIILNETHPNNTYLSLYEYVLKDKDFPWVNHQGQSITVQDCFRTRDDLILQRAVRECLKKMNYTVVEMEENYDKTKYCGVWLHNPPAKDCLEVAPKSLRDIMENYIHLLSEEEQVKCMKKWVIQYTTNQVLVYCNGCERGIRLGEREPIHLIELLAEGLLK